MKDVKKKIKKFDRGRIAIPVLVIIILLLISNYKFMNRDRQSYKILPEGEIGMSSIDLTVNGDNYHEVNIVRVKRMIFSEGYSLVTSQEKSEQNGVIVEDVPAGRYFIEAVSEDGKTLARKTINLKDGEREVVELNIRGAIPTFFILIFQIILSIRFIISLIIAMILFTVFAITTKKKLGWLLN